jgi:hypothetical protein
MNPHVFPHKLFNEAVHHSIFDCTVEVGPAYHGLDFVSLSTWQPGPARGV